jgi:hypothetical protein
LVTLKADVAWYLDHPEEFGRFYVVARLYAAVWGLVGLWAVLRITRRLGGGVMLPAGLCYVFMPVVINMAHEAKPHLPGAVLQLLAIMAAMRYVETGRRAWWIAAGVLCGAAFGMVLSAWPVFIILPLMASLRARTWPQGATVVAGGASIGAATYLAANPYIVINLFVNREVLRSNFGNSLAMYAVGPWPEAVANAARLIGEGASLTVAIIGSLALVIGVVRYVLTARRRLDHPAEPTQRGLVFSSQAKDWMLLVAPALTILVQFTALAAGKPGEYGRFAVLPDVVLGIVAVVGVCRVFQNGAGRAVGLAMLLFLVAVPGFIYLSAFMADSRAGGSRAQRARVLDFLNSGGALTLAVYADPAPYGLPPVDLTTWRIMLLPKGYPIDRADPPVDVVMRPSDDSGAVEDLPENYLWAGPKEMRFSHDISWADKPFALWVRRSLFPTETAPATAPSDHAF